MNVLNVERLLPRTTNGFFDPIPAYKILDMSRDHTAMIFRCRNTDLLHCFLRRYHIDRGAGPPEVILQCARAFSNLPYENLTKIIKSDEVLSPESALRHPDEVLADHLKWGTGGTCFSLTAALIAVFNELGFHAQPLLADRHYGPDTHCGLVVLQDKQWLLIDPGYLFYIPTPIPEHATSIVTLGYSDIELRPFDAGSRIELATLAGGIRRVRLTYKRAPVDAAAFKQAWIDSFTWEMMTYPVLTRSTAGRHIYVQGSSATVRTFLETNRSRMEPVEQLDFITQKIGIARDVVLKAWEVVGHGTT